MSRRRRSLLQSGGDRVLYGVDNVAAVYSLRMLAQGYSGPLICIRRDQDDAEIDIYARPDKSIDEAAVTSFLNSSSPASTTAFVTTWYDQSGNGNDATQSSASAQPTFTTNVQNGKPGILFATNDWFNADSLASVGSSAHSVVFSTLPDANPAIGNLYAIQLDGDVGDQETILINASGQLGHFDGSIDILDTNNWVDVPFVFSLVATGSNTTTKINNANTNNISSFADTLRAGLNQFSIGQEYDPVTTPSNFYNGHMFDMIVTSDVVTSDERTSIDTNLMAYLGIS